MLALPSIPCGGLLPMLLDFDCCRGNRLCGGDQRAFRSPFGNLRSPLLLIDFYRKFFSCVPFVLLSNITNQVAWECAAKGSRGRPQTSSVLIAPLSRPQARNPCATRESSMEMRATQSRERESRGSKTLWRSPEAAPLAKRGESKNVDCL